MGIYIPNLLYKWEYTQNRCSHDCPWRQGLACLLWTCNLNKVLHPTIFIQSLHCFNSSPPGQNGRHFADGIFKWISMNEKFCTLVWILLNFVHKGPIDNKWTLVQVMATSHYSISQEICTRSCFAVLCCGYTLTDFPISIRLTSLALWQSNDCPSASKATLMNMDKYFMWIHYGWLHNHNKAKHNETVCIFLGIYCTSKLTSADPVHWRIHMRH